jgi:hypothetical protein
MGLTSPNIAQGRHLLNMRTMKSDEKRCLDSESCGRPSSIFVDFIVHHREASFFTVTALMFMQKTATFGQFLLKVTMVTGSPLIGAFVCQRPNQQIREWIEMPLC